MSASTSRRGHVQKRPASSARILSNMIRGPQAPNMIRQNAIWPGTYQHELPEGSMAIASVENIQFGRPSEYPAREEIEPENGNRARNSYTVIFTKNNKRKGDRLESRYDLNLYENTAFRGQGQAKRTMLAAFRFGSNVQLEVRLLREVRELQLFKFHRNPGKTNKLEDIFWTMNLTEEPLEVFRQCHEFWTTLRRCLEKMPMSHLAYANVERQMIGPAPVSSLPSIQFRAMTDSEHVVSLDHVEKKRAVAATHSVEGPHPNPFIVPVPNSQGGDWVFPGYLSDPSLMAEVAKLSLGMSSEESSSTTKLQNTTCGLKGKKRREKKAAKALSNIQELDDAEDTEFMPTLKRSAPEGSGQTKRQRR